MRDTTILNSACGAFFMPGFFKCLKANKDLNITIIGAYMSYYFPESLNISDLIVFGNIGGYSIVSKHPFIQPNYRILCYSSDGEIVEIKLTETFDNIFQTFIF